jgi:hypothetical protein
MQDAFGLEVPETLEEACDPTRTALLVYDMQVGVLRQVPKRSAIVDARATCSVKCSVVMNEIAALRGSLAASLDFASPSGQSPRYASDERTSSATPRLPSPPRGFQEDLP